MKRWIASPLSAVKTVFRRPLVLGLNVLAIPVLMAGAWGWLYIPVSNIPLVLVSVALLLALVVALLLLVVYTYNTYYAAQHLLHPVSSQGIKVPGTSVANRSLVALPLLLAWFAVFGLLCMSVTWVGAFTLDLAKSVASALTMVSQQPVSFYSVNAVLERVLQAVQWLVLPLVSFALFAGFATAALRKGKRRQWLRNALRNLWDPLYWVGWIAFAAVGLWLPAKLAAWVPPLDGIPAATISMVVRFGLALGLGILCWLLFLSLLARLTQQPRESVIIVTGEAGARPA